MNMKSIMGLSPVMLAFACGVTPSEGEWELSTNVTWNKDECNLQSQMDLSLNNTFDLALTETGFTIDEEVVCTLEGSNFTCDWGESTSSEDYSDMGMDAVLKMVNTLGGSFSSNTAMTIDTTFQYSCEGADCADLNAMIEEVTLPCESEYTIEGNYLGPKEQNLVDE